MKLVHCQIPSWSTSSCWLSLCMLACQSLLVPAISWAIDPMRIEYLWQSSPKLDFDWELPPFVPAVVVTPANIQSAAVEERMRAAQNIVRAPNSSRIDGPVVLAALLEHLQSGEPHATVRCEMIAAACELDDGSHADQLWKLAQNDPAARRAVERACIDWKAAVPLDLWRRTIDSPLSSEQELLYAADGLAVAGTKDDLNRLETLVMDAARSIPFRVRCAAALGRVAESDQMQIAKQLRQSKTEHAERMAVEVLRRSPVPSSTEFVQELALHGQATAQRAAYQWLCDRDPATAQRMASQFFQHPDAVVRGLAHQQIAEALNAQTLPALFAGFQDENPQVRKTARELVLECCTRSEAQLEVASELLQKSMDSTDWRELEQAIRLAVEFQQSTYCPRLLALVNHPRPEVTITASWALRHLAEEPEVLAQMLQHVQLITSKLAAKSGDLTEVHLRSTAHLLEAFGLRKYEPAKEVALQYVPKRFHMGLITRMTAIWTCGQLWEGAENKSLIEQLHQCIADKATQFPEPMSVRFTATLALGWIGDPDSRQPLIQNDEPTAPIGYATEWALQRIAK